jgi:L-fucose isomerase-like protein
MSMMGEKLTPSACGVDVMGAVSMYALALAAHAPSAILDGNNNYGHHADKCVCTHCGNYPRSFIRAGFGNLDSRVSGFSA